jgi:hypothetical protein
LVESPLKQFVLDDGVGVLVGVFVGVGAVPPPPGVGVGEAPPSLPLAHFVRPAACFFSSPARAFSFLAFAFPVAFLISFFRVLMASVSLVNVSPS